MFTTSLKVTGDIGGVVLNSQINRTAPGQIGQYDVANAAKAGTLSTRTNDTDGTLTLGAGHGITDADVVDLYWEGGRRYNVVVGTVAGNDVPISGGAGDNLPTEDDAITVAKQQVYALDVDADLLVAIAAVASGRGRLQFYATASLELGIDCVANEPFVWWDESTAANPLAGDAITHVTFTQAGTTDGTFRLGLLYDSES